MVTFTASPMQITHTRAPKPGGHSQYGFWPLDPEGLLHGLLATTPGSLPWAPLQCAQELSVAATHGAVMGCLPLMAVQISACLLASSCGERHSHHSLSGTYPAVLPLLYPASSSSSSARWRSTRKWEREGLVSHKYLFILAEGKKVIYGCSCLQQVVSYHEAKEFGVKWVKYISSCWVVWMQSWNVLVRPVPSHRCELTTFSQGKQCNCPMYIDVIMSC